MTASLVRCAIDTWKLVAYTFNLISKSDCYVSMQYVLMYLDVQYSNNHNEALS